MAAKKNSGKLAVSAGCIIAICSAGAFAQPNPNAVVDLLQTVVGSANGGVGGVVDLAQGIVNGTVNNLQLLEGGAVDHGQDKIDDAQLLGTLLYNKAHDGLGDAKDEAEGKLGLLHNVVSDTEDNTGATTNLVASLNNTVAHLSGTIGFDEGSALAGGLDTLGGTLGVAQNNGAFNGLIDTGRGTVVTTAGDVNEGTLGLLANSHGSSAGIVLVPPAGPSIVQVPFLNF